MTLGGVARRWPRRRTATGAGSASPDPIARAVDAEDEYRRMCALQGMAASELRRLLAGDLAEAAPWMRAAARLGLVEGQLRLGQMLLDGLGVARDEAAGLGWFLSAARKGSPAAMNMAGRCYENGWGAAPDLAEAAAWYLRSAEAGHDWGEYNYANMLFDGRGVAEDRPQAVRWYLSAAEQGHGRAMNLLARCLEEGWGTPRDPAQAFRWYRASAESGYFRAQFNYAAILAALGRLDDAMPWFEKAISGATPDSRPGMIGLLRSNPDARLAALGERLAVELATA
jgi:TPR repeat protein